MVKTPSSSAGDMGSTPGQGTKIPHASGQPSPHATTMEPPHSNKNSCARKERFLVTQPKINEHFFKK